MIIYKGAAHYRGCYPELDDAMVLQMAKVHNVALVNPYAVLTKLLGPYKRSALLLPSTTPQSYRFLNTPHNRQNLRQ